MPANVIYLHGFASSPGSTKAGIFRDLFASRGVNFTIPDLNVPDFEHLTLTAMLERAAETVQGLPDGPVYLIGSSFGGLTALHFIDRYGDAEAGRVEKLVLMAPALDFMANRVRHLGEGGMVEWKERGYLLYDHYGYNEERPVHYGLIEDLQQYDSYGVRINLPVLIFHGVNDESVDYNQSVRFAEDRPNVDLYLLESDHTLIDQIETMWAAMVKFLEV